MRELRRVKTLDREKLEELASWLAKRIEELIQRETRLLADEVSVRVDISEEWPYTVEAEIFVKTSHRAGSLEYEVERILDEAFMELIEKAAEEGFKPSS